MPQLKRVKATGFDYALAEDVGGSATREDLSSRLEAILPASTPREVEQAVLVTLAQPQDRFEDALSILAQQDDARRRRGR